MLPSKRLFFCLLPLASALLTACSITPPGPATSPDSPQWHQQEKAVSQLKHYETRGAFAYLTDQKRVYARFFWQQYSPDNYRLLLTNPLGSTEMELNVKPGIVVLTDNQGKRYVSDNADLMISKLTGMSIPLEQLRLWMLGLPGNAKDFTLNSQYRLSQVKEEINGQLWIVEYQDYSDDTHPALPSGIELHHNDQRIKLRMDSWTL